MFTGLVEKTGIVKSVSKSSKGLALGISASGSAPIFDDLKIGDSIAINGVCQTITSLGNGSSGKNDFTVQVMFETLKLTNLDSLKTGDNVNLERAMHANGRFGGHFVSGHVDATAQLVTVKKEGFSSIFRFNLDTKCTKYIVKKGSITVNGASLTVSNVGTGFFEVSLIPHTLENTNLGELRTGDFVNIEVDMLAKYVEKFLCGRDNESKISENFLRECGF